jgi:exonuclease III
MRFMSWNVGRRVGRLPDQIEALKKLQPDVVALQEVTPSTASLFFKVLPTIGLYNIADSFSLAQDKEILKGPRHYGELIASCWPLSSILPTRFRIPWPERILSVEINSPVGLIECHTTHIPPGASNGWIKIETLEGIYNCLAIANTKLRILCGDFNTPKDETQDGQFVTWAERRKKNGEIVPVLNRGKRWDAAERNVLLGLKEFDLSDVYRSLYGYTVQDYSWYTNNKGVRIGRRFDHVYASQALNPVSCRYLGSLREEGLSDHSPIEVEFRL